MRRRLNRYSNRRILHEYMTDMEITKEIKKILKQNGFSGKGISIRRGRGGIDSSIIVNVNRPVTDTLLKVLDQIKKFESIDRDPRTFEILSGGNTYISIRINGISFGGYDNWKKFEDDEW